MNKTPVSDLDYELPVGSIAQEPYRNPEDSKILDASTKEIYKFLDIDKLIDSKSLLLFNSSQVIDVRIKTRKIKTDGQFEIFILEILGKNTAICLIKTRGKKILNEEILLENFNLTLVSQEKDKFEVFKGKWSFLNVSINIARLVNAVQCHSLLSGMLKFTNV